MKFILAGLVIAAVVVVLLVLIRIRQKNLGVWLPSYLRSSLQARPVAPEGPTHVIFCVADHYEPMSQDPGIEAERKRVDKWLRDYPKLAGQFVDADGKHPRHTFFYPAEVYLEEHLTKLADLCSRGYGEIEVHLHHRDDTPGNFRKSLSRFVDIMHERHGAFGKHRDSGAVSWSFIHGNWALCNSHPEGRGCGVNEELGILDDLGCNCDMTLPSSPSPTQTRTINSIYYATDIPGQPKPHDTGIAVEVGGEKTGDLMLVQGPLALNWGRRRMGILPAIENGDITSYYPPTADRVDLWVKTGVHVKGKPEWVFVKVHTHGALEDNAEALLGSVGEDMHRHLGQKYNDGDNYVLHYASAREMYNIIKAAEAGEEGNPNAYRDYVVSEPRFRAISDAR